MARLSNTSRRDLRGFAPMLALLVALLIGTAGLLARDWPSEGESANWLARTHGVTVTFSVVGNDHQCRCDDDIHHVLMASRRDDGAIVPPPLPAATAVAALSCEVPSTTPPIAAGTSRGSLPDRRIAMLRTTRLVI